MKEWDLIKSVQGNAILRLEYGELRATVSIKQQPNIFSFYEVAWEVQDELGVRGYAGKTSVSQYDLVRLQKHGKITDQTIVDLLRPAADMARVAMFMCIAEKLI